MVEQPMEGQGKSGGRTRQKGGKTALRRGLAEGKCGGGRMIFFIEERHILKFLRTFASRKQYARMITKLYNDNPNVREVRRIADMLRDGGVAILPTDTLYAFACSMEHKRAVEEIAQLKGFKIKQAKYSMLCSSLSQASEYVRAMDRDTFALLKRCLPGPFTFIMEASGNVPRNYQNSNKTIGIRVPDNEILRAIIEEVGAPLIATSVRPIGEEDEVENYTDPELIHDRFGGRVAVVVDGGIADAEPSTVIDCSDGIELVRQGKGIVEL